MRAPGREGFRSLGLQAVVSLLAVLLVVGCNDSKGPKQTSVSASEVLDKMLVAYQQAMTYADSGEVRLHYTLDGKTVDQTFPWSVTLERPNKLRAHIYGATVVCDGKDFWASLVDLRDQVLKLNAPAVLTSKNVYATPTLTDEMSNRVASGSIALAFLLDDNPLAPILQDSQSPKLLEAQTIDQSPCYGVSIRRKDGELKFWIDQGTFVLRRFEYPLDGLREHLSQQGKIGDLSLVADLRGAQLNGKVEPVAFQFEAPGTAKLVSEFDIIPQPEPPTKLLGSKVPEFEFTALDGKKIDRKSLAGKVTVLVVWAACIVPSVENLTFVEPVYEKFKNDERVKFLAVSIDTAPGSSPVQVNAADGAGQLPVSTDQELRTSLTKAKVTLPVARDLKQEAQSQLGVIPIPSVVVVGSDGTLEDQIIGVEPELSKLLPERLEKLLAGGSLYRDAQQRYEEQMRKYEQQFQTPGESQQPAKATPAARSEPTKFTLEPMWKCDELTEPGNVLVVMNEGKPTLLVHDGWSTVVELDENGKVSARHRLDLPKDAKEGIVLYLRTAVDSAGARWYAGSASNGQQVHVFDAQWKRQFSYPEGDTTAGVADAQFGDLDGDGQPELNVSFFDVVGVHNVALDSHQRRWSNRSLANVFSVAVTSPDDSHRRSLWCTNELGTIVPINYQGQEGQPVYVGSRFMRLVRADDLNNDGTAELVGIASTKPGDDTLVGLGAQGREAWNYPLPAGMQPIGSLESITSGTLRAADKSRAWIVAGVDGSVHLIDAKGAPIDRWNHGSAIAGLALVNLPTPTVIVSSGKTVQAWALKPRGE